MSSSMSFTCDRIISSSWRISSADSWLCAACSTSSFTSFTASGTTAESAAWEVGSFDSAVSLGLLDSAVSLGLLDSTGSIGLADSFGTDSVWGWCRTRVSR